jgi:hypothetical protein
LRGVSLVRVRCRGGAGGSTSGGASGGVRCFDRGRGGLRSGPSVAIAVPVVSVLIFHFLHILSVMSRPLRGPIP